MKFKKLILVFAGLVLATMFGSCGEQCLGYSPTDGTEMFKDERSYTDGISTVIMSERIDPKFADYLLSQVQACSQEILTQLQIDSPYKNHLVYVFRNNDIHHTFCGHFAKDAEIPDFGGDADDEEGEEEEHIVNETHNCARGGVAFKFLTPEEIDELNQSVRDGKKQPTSECTGEEYALNHELSHLLRAHTADPWWGAEEGAAEYTKFALEKNLIASKMSRLSSVIGEKDLQPQEVWVLPSYETHGFGLFIDKIWFKSLGVSSATLAYTSTGIIRGYRPGRVIEQDVPLSKCTSLVGLIVCLGPKGERGVHVILYNTFGRIDAYAPDCAAEGIRSFKSIWGAPSLYLTDDLDEVLSAYTWGEPSYVNYSELTKDVIGWERDGIYPRMYTSGYCFWDLIRQSYGDNAVISIFQAMQVFSKKHQSNSANFPFFNTVVETTGMNVEEAQKFFNRHHMPVDDAQHPIGGVCWEN